MIEVKLFNSLTEKKEVFKSIKENEVTMYVCGPTVYNHLHIGNCRPIIVFDILVRFLQKIGYKVNYISNITDVDDRIIASALSEGKSEEEFTNFYIDAYLELRRNLNVLVPTHLPRVKDYIPEIIDFIDVLVKKDYAYVVDGEVFFDQSKIPTYGELSKIRIEDNIAGSRVEINDKKRNHFDFLLWKDTKEGIKWHSNWCEGRPGWHTECVVMINTINSGFPIDIHGGGFDLKFPHHENELAQARAYSNVHLANYWMHNGFINLNSEKMSKSLGNVVLGKDIIKQYSINSIKLALLETYYRSPFNFTEEIIQAAQTEDLKIQKLFKQISIDLFLNDAKIIKTDSNLLDEALKMLADDLNTPNVVTLIFEVIKKINIELKNKNYPVVGNDFANLTEILDVLGLKYDILELSEEDCRLLKNWNQSRLDKDYVNADIYRKQLVEKKIL
jgi:cysteinyl-tRNA synthetase